MGQYTVTVDSTGEVIATAGSIFGAKREAELFFGDGTCGELKDLSASIERLGFAKLRDSTLGESCTIRPKEGGTDRGLWFRFRLMLLRLWLRSGIWR